MASSRKDLHVPLEEHHEDEDEEAEEVELEGIEGAESSEETRGSSAPNHSTEFEDKPLRFKVFAFLCSCFLAVGNHFAAQMLFALKGTLIQELGITNAQYGLLSSAVALVNTVVPFLGGIFIDIFGTGAGSVVASLLIFFGNTIVATSTHVSSFPLMIFGRVIYGLGAGCIVTVQESILAHWFKGRGLAIALGSQIAAARLSGFLATGTVVPIAEATGFYGNAFWVCASISAFSFLAVMAYVGMLWYLGENRSQSQMEMKNKLSKKSRFKLSALYSFSSHFWMITLISFAFGGTWAPFLTIAPDLLKTNFGGDDAAAGWTSSVNLVVPVILSPFMGFLIDRWGKRTWLIFFSAVILVPSFALLGFSQVDPLLGLIIFSFSLTIGPVALISSIPLMLDTSVVGTALGIYKCASNISTTIVSPLVGLTQDTYNGYDQVIIILLAIAAATAVASVGMIVMDHFLFHSLLDMKAEERTVYVKDKTFEEIAPVAKRWLTTVYLALSALALVASWVIFFALVIAAQLQRVDHP